MAGYTRQSAAQIFNGADITAPPLNAEFNKLEDAFDGSTGHSHDGTVGQGPKINLQTSLSGYLPAVHGGTGGKNNFTATANPVVTNDFTEGYAVGSLWENTSTGRVFICVGNTTGSAVWRELVLVNGTAAAILPETNDTTDLGSPTYRFQDLYLSGGISTQGNASIGGTTTLTGTLTANGAANLNGLTTAAQVDVNSGTIDNTVIGSTTASPITGTQITANSGFIGSVTGDVSGNVTSTGTSSFNNITASGTITGSVTGDISGNVTSSGTSTFNNVTISGTLNMDGSTTATIQNLTDPTNPQDAATRNYVDTEIANLVAAAPSTLDTLNELAAALGDDANFSTTMTNALAGKVADTGDTMTGDLIMSGGAKVTGLPTPTTNSDAGSKAYIDQQDGLQVSRSGDTMSGTLDMGSNKITNLGTPTAGTDSANKTYVDGILGSATAASASAAAAATSEANAATSAANSATSATLSEDWATDTTSTVDGSEYSAKEYAVGTQTRGTTGSSKDWATYTGGTVDGTEYSAKYYSNLAASSTTQVQQFFDTYYVSASQPTGSSVTVGDLWFDTANNIMKVYGASGFQNAGSSVNGTAERADYVVGTSSGSYTGSTTTFPAVYDTGFVDVYLNGVKLAASDFTATNGSSIVLASAAATGDSVGIVAYGTFELADAYTQTQSDARYLQQSQADARYFQQSQLNVDVQAYDANLTSFVSTFELPTTDGSTGQFLKTDGAGNLSFATVDTETSLKQSFLL